MKYRIFLFSFLGLSLSFWSHSAAPKLSSEQAHRVVQQFLQSQKLYWSPSQFPIQIERKSKSALAKQLDILFQQHYLNRTKGSKWVEANNISEKRQRIALYWDYNLDTHHESGFIYGRANLKRVIERSEVKNYSGNYYVQVHISWYVDQMPDWTQRPEFHSIRLIRRSKESFNRPFERVLYLHHRKGRWVVWKPKAEKAQQ